VFVNTNARLRDGDDENKKGNITIRHQVMAGGARKQLSKPASRWRNASITTRANTV
jgi:hypothetical protein